MSQTELQAACEALEREHPGYVFRANFIRDNTYTAFRFVAAVDGHRTEKHTGWCPTVKGAADEMRYILLGVKA